MGGERVRDSDFEAAARALGTEMAGAWADAFKAKIEARVGELASMEIAAGVIRSLLHDNAQQLAYIQKLEAENAALRAAYTRQTQLALAAGLVRWVMTGDRP